MNKKRVKEEYAVGIPDLGHILHKIKKRFIQIVEKTIFCGSFVDLSGVRPSLWQLFQGHDSEAQIQ